MSCDPLTLETVWLDKYKFEDAERIYHERSYKLQWIKSSSKMSDTKVESKEESKEVQPIKDAAKEEPLLLPMDKGEKIEAVAPLLEEVKKPAKEKKKDDKAPQKKETEKKDDVTEKDEKNGDKQAKKKNKEDDVKEKQAKKKKPEKSANADAKKSKDEKIDNVVTNESSVESAVKTENPIEVTSKEESPSKDEGKKGNKKTKKNKNKKNEQVDGKQESSESKKDSNETVKEPGSKKADKKELAAEQQKKKADKKESKKVNPHCSPAGKSSLADEIARARQHIKNSLNCDSGISANDSANLLTRIKKLEDENKRLRNMADDVKKMTQFMSKLVARVDELETSIKSNKGCCPISSPPTKTEDKSKKEVADDDIDLFGSDDDDAEKEKVKAERLRLYEEKKAKKPVLVAKSNIILDVKPWDDETDMKAMEVKVREVACDGLLWGASKLVPLAFGIHKLQISSVIEDDKVSVDWLQEQIEANEDLVQSVDIAAFNKV